MQETHLTADGVKKYEERLEYLKNERRTEISEQIKVARSFGDLSENAEYDAAKNEQARNEYDIVELENLLRNVVVIDEDNIDTSTVNVGASVKVKNIAMDMEFEYRIVGSAEADPMSMRISNESPIGKGMIGHKVGDKVDIVTPGGIVPLEILSIGKVG